MTQLIEVDGWQIWPPVRFSYNTIDYSHEVTPSPPDGRHFLGTDGGGTDVFAKLLYEFRLSVLFGIALTMISSSIGVLVGALQGYLGGLVDLIGQRMVEIFAGLPILFVLIILASIVEPNVFWLLGILALFSWMALVSVVRAEFLRARNYEFVLAARSLGVSNLTILRRHVLPNPQRHGREVDVLAFHIERHDHRSDRTTLAMLLTLLIFIGEAFRDTLDPRQAVAKRGDGGAGLVSPQTA